MWSNVTDSYLKGIMNTVDSVIKNQTPKYDNWGITTQLSQSVLQNQQKQATALQKWQSMASSGNAATLNNALGQNLQKLTSAKQMDITLKQAQSIKKFFS